MKIEINGTAKEIADLVVALQSQQINEITESMISMDGEKLSASISHQIQRVFEEARS